MVYYFFIFDLYFFIFKKRDVGKTTLKRRLMGVSDQNENKNAHKLVQKDKTEEDMFKINFLFFEFFILNLY